MQLNLLFPLRGFRENASSGMKKHNNILVTKGLVVLDFNLEHLR